MTQNLAACVSMQLLQGATSAPAALAATEVHVQFCFDTLSAHLSGDSGPVATGFDDAIW